MPLSEVDLLKRAGYCLTRSNGVKPRCRRASGRRISVRNVDWVYRDGQQRGERAVEEAGESLCIRKLREECDEQERDVYLRASWMKMCSLVTEHPKMLPATVDERSEDTDWIEGMSTTLPKENKLDPPPNPVQD